MNKSYLQLPERLRVGVGGRTGQIFGPTSAAMPSKN